MPAGLTSTGFVAKQLADILDELNADTSAALSNVPGNPVNVSAASAIGQVNGIIAAQLADVWSALQAVESSFDPNAAVGDALSTLSLITGTVKRNATYSLATNVTVTVQPGLYPSGTLVASVVGNPSAQFASMVDVNNATSGLLFFAGLTFKAVSPGAVAAPAGTLTVIAQPVTGWTSVTNALDAVVGQPVETDPQLRQRRVAELQGGGSTDVDAIRADILRNLGVAAGGDVLSCSVLANDTNLTDVNGLPPHSFECLVLGRLMDEPSNMALANQIYASKAAGDQASGTTTRLVQDSQGNWHWIGFSRPASQLVYVSVTVQHDPKLPMPLASDVQAAIMAYGGTLQVGATVVLSRIEAAALSVPGVFDVTALAIGTAPSPSGTVNLPITVRQIAVLDTSRVAVTVI